MPAPTTPAIEFGPATLDDLLRVEGKAELVAGRIIANVGSGYKPSRIALKLAMRLEAYTETTMSGIAFGDGMVFACIPPLANGRQSFSPDACYYDGPLPENEMRYAESVPTFAVEVRSENDYGRAAEAELQAKRADYFEAGTQIVWDIDPKVRAIAVFADGDPTTPSRTFRSGDTADAEPILPGWRLDVSAIFS